MSDFLDEVAADCSEAENDLGAKLMTWGDNDYPVAASLVARDSSLIIGGREVSIRLVLRVRISGSQDGMTWKFNTLPVHGQRVTYGGIDYRIAAVDNAHETFLQIHLMDVNR
jgi:hypothetical protein